MVQRCASESSRKQIYIQNPAHLESTPPTGPRHQQQHQQQQAHEKTTRYQNLPSKCIAISRLTSPSGPKPPHRTARAADNPARLVSVRSVDPINHTTWEDRRFLSRPLFQDDCDICSLGCPPCRPRRSMAEQDEAGE